MELHLVWINDEECEIWMVSGMGLPPKRHLVTTMGHGPHGWDGMQGMKETAVGIAQAAGWPVLEFGESAT